MKANKLVYLLMLLVLFVSACAPAAPAVESATEEPVVEATDAPEEAEAPTADAAEGEEMEVAAEAISVTATGEGFEGPQSVPAGWTEVVLVNQSEGRRQAAILRFEDGMSVEDLTAALQEGLRGLPAWLTAVGGPAGVMPGASGSAIVQLEAGDYVILDPAPDEEGVPGLAKGYLFPFSVTEEDNGAAAPEATANLELADFAFIVDQEAMVAGSVTLRITNSGPDQAHEVAIIKLNEGASVQDFLAATAPDAPPGPPPGMGVAGLASLAIGEEAYLELDLESGATYGLICFLPSGAHQGAPHFTLGMVAEFLVP